MYLECMRGVQGKQEAEQSIFFLFSELTFGLHQEDTGPRRACACFKQEVLCRYFKVAFK